MPLRFRPLLIADTLATALTGPAFLSAAVIGTNTSALPLTADRLAALPAAERAAWSAYLARSQQLRAADQAAFAAELKSAGLTAPLVPTKGRALPPLPPADGWSGPEATRLADIVVSFQTPAGGWSKNTQLTLAPRRPGERYGSETGYDGTIDNDGTVGPLRYLAKVIAATSAATPTHPRLAAWQASFTRGIEYLLTAQYPNGGWPQVFPLVGSYHDAITFNDGALVNVLTLLRDLAAARDEFAAAPAPLRARAVAAADRGLACILASQIVTDGRRTVWCQQVDPLTLAPCPARAYEMPSQSSGESAGLTLYLLAIPEPTPAIVTAVHAAAAWFQKTSLRDVNFKHAPDGSGRKLLPAPGNTPIWPRFSQIGTDRPIFGDRDLTIHDDVNDLSRERRNGYAWFGDNPKRTLDHYTKWAKRHPAK